MTAFVNEGNDDLEVGNGSGNKSVFRVLYVNGGR